MTPEIHSLSFDQYLAADGVSSSMLRIISDRSPLHLKCWLEGEKPEPTPAQRFGTLVHRCIFEPDTVNGAFHVRPAGLNFTTKDGKSWRDAHQDKPILSEDESAQILAMVASVHHHPTAKHLLKNAQFERSIFVEDSHGTLRKFRPDVWPDGGNVLPDLKTCESAHPDKFTKSLFDYGYWRQGAYYLDGAKLAGQEFTAFAFIAVEKSPPYAVAVYQLDPQAVDIGRMFYQRDLAVYRQCLETGKWPGYELGAPIISLPEWFTRQVERVA